MTLIADIFDEIVVNPSTSEKKMVTAGCFIAGTGCCDLRFSTTLCGSICRSRLMFSFFSFSSALVISLLYFFSNSSIKTNKDNDEDDINDDDDINDNNDDNGDNDICL